MMETEFVRDLQSLLNCLEEREHVGHEEYSSLHTKLREVIGRLREMERFSSRRGQLHGLRAQWLN